MFKKFVTLLKKIFIFWKEYKEEEKPIEPAKPVFEPTDHGRLIVWHVGGNSENAGKRIEVYEDGYHEMTAKSLFECIDGLTDWYADHVADAEEMRDAVVTKIECITYTWLNGIKGKYEHTGEVATVPDKTKWVCELSSGGHIEFTSIASADCIQPGFIYMWDKQGRPQHHPGANGHGVGAHSYYKDKRTYIR